MELSKKEIIYKLAKGVMETRSPQSYGITRRKLTEKAGISEIALYSAMAEHIEENDINPNSMINEVNTLINGCIENSFFIKTSDSFSYLLPSFNDLLMRNNPPEDSKFLCNKCYLIKPRADIHPSPNYKNTCSCCVSLYTKNLHITKKYVKKKDRPVIEEKIIDEPEVEQEAEKVEQIKQVEYIEPFVSLKGMIADPKISSIELSVKTTDTLKLLSILDEYLIPAESE